MSETTPSKGGHALEVISQIAGILLPVVVAVVGGLYTYQKDKSDARTLQREERRDLKQVQYGNLTSLIPLLTSQDASTRLLGMEIFTSEAKKREAPLDLVPSIRRLGAEHPESEGQAMAAVAAANEQSKAQPSGN